MQGSEVKNRKMSIYKECSYNIKLEEKKSYAQWHAWNTAQYIIRKRVIDGFNACFSFTGNVQF